MRQQNTLPNSRSKLIAPNPAYRIAAKMTVSAIILFPASCWVGSLLIDYEVLEPIRFSDYCFVVASSIALGFLSLAPMLRVTNFGIPKNPMVTSTDSQNATFLGILLSGMTIRFIGTIALVVLCRYHIGTAEQTVAVSALIWFVSLTMVSVYATVAEVSRLRFSPSGIDDAKMVNSKPKTN